jgi:hypothetical protein
LSHQGTLSKQQWVKVCCCTVLRWWCWWWWSDVFLQKFCVSLWQGMHGKMHTVVTFGIHCLHTLLLHHRFYWFLIQILWWFDYIFLFQNRYKIFLRNSWTSLSWQNWRYSWHVPEGQMSVQYQVGDVLKLLQQWNSIKFILAESCVKMWKFSNVPETNSIHFLWH